MSHKWSDGKPSPILSPRIFQIGYTIAMLLAMLAMSINWPEG